MVTMYFGLPGCGKTTMLCANVYKQCYSKRSPYKHIYGNIDIIGIPNYVKINANDLGKYALENCAIHIDEGTLQFDSRDYKNFSKALVSFFMTHRHWKCDIFIYTQAWDGVDRKIRLITDRVFYLHKGFLTGWYKTKVWRIPYGILIPDKNSNGSDKYGEIIQGYYKPPFFVRLFTPNLKRRRYYKYFDSWSHPELPELPPERIQAQKEYNLKTYEYLLKLYNETPKNKFGKRAELTKLIKKQKKCLT